MRFSELTRNIVTRLAAKPTKIELINLLTQITKDRLASIIDNFWGNLKPKPTNRHLLWASKKAVIKGMAELAEVVKKNGNTLTRTDYRDLISDIRKAIAQESYDDNVDQWVVTCELLIASLPWRALEILWLETIPWDKNGRPTRIVKQDHSS